MRVTSLSLYRPTWSADGVARSPGSDEDEITMVVAALRPLVEAGEVLRRIVVVTRSPALVEGNAAAVIAHAVGLPDLPVQHVLGGGPSVIDQMLSGASGTAVVGVEVCGASGAGAVLLADSGADLSAEGRERTSLPARVRHLGDAAARNYDDPRLLREIAWRPALISLAGDGPSIAVGVPASLADVAGADRAASEAVGVDGPAAVAFGLAACAERGGGRLVAVEQDVAAAVRLTGSPTVHRSERPAIAWPDLRYGGDAEIPISLAAYARAFEAKVGLQAGCCPNCSTLSCPPRYHCLECGAEGAVALVALPRRATVYTVVTVRVPVPGLTSPYTLAIVELEGVDVRLLVQVADVPPGSTAIGDEGELVLRKVADRHGIPDYGYAFCPSVETVREEAA